MFLEIKDFKLKPKARPRIGKGGVYSPTKKNEDALAWKIKEALLNKGGISQYTQDLFVVWILWSKGNILGDKDNYEKAIYDGLQKSGLIKNDKQIIQGFQVLHGNMEEEKLIIMIYPLLGEANLRYVYWDDEIGKEVMSPW